VSAVDEAREGKITFATPELAGVEGVEEKNSDMFSMISRPSSRLSLRVVRFCQMAIV
jgi:hypothetical protein